MSCYRVHPANESLDTMLDASRPDGWTMSDEVSLRGLAVCTSLEGLLSYIRTYGMTVCPGDKLVRVDGRQIDPDHDAHAVRIEATSYEVLGDAREWLDAIATLTEACEDWDVDADES